MQTLARTRFATALILFVVLLVFTQRKIVSATTLPPFSGTISQVTATQRAAMLASHSWHSGCPVPISKLRVVTVSYFGFDAKVHRGQMMVNADVTSKVIKAFASMYTSRFPIHTMKLIDAYAANDEKSMRADNTSGFNCRLVAGTKTWSQHSYGRAIDINPMENPWVSGRTIDPVTARRNANRALHATGTILANGTAVKAFRTIGWIWGGTWRAPKDYMHFSRNGL